jgi:hypothetical protein
VLQPEHVNVKVLIALQITDGNRDVINGLNAVSDFCHHVVPSSENMVLPKPKENYSIRQQTANRGSKRSSRSSRLKRLELRTQ